MFEPFEIDRKLSSEEYAAREPELRTALLEYQRRFRDRDIPMVILVAGIEGAGKSHVVNRLLKWLDGRYLATHAFWDETDDERERPYFWRFWRVLPRRGETAVMFGSWYTQPLLERTFGRLDASGYRLALDRIAHFERMLERDGTLIVKLWLHASRSRQQDVLRRRQSAGRLQRREEQLANAYDAYVIAAEQAIRATDSSACPWHLIPSGHARYRDMTVAQVLCHSMEQRLEAEQLPEQGDSRPLPDSAYSGALLDTIDLANTLPKAEYKQQIHRKQKRLGRLTWDAFNRCVSTVVVLEGWDAGGKGGVIRRITGAMDARLCRVISTGTPSEEELAHHYLWRFWRHMPRAGYMTIYDRSWYGRVLVERVENLVPPSRWPEAYAEINELEEQLREHGTTVVKFWLHISEDEQLRRFRARENTPWKRHKLTDEDWRNRRMRKQYTEAVEEMVARTSTSAAPWHLIPAGDKRFARVDVLRILCERLEDRLR